LPNPDPHLGSDSLHSLQAWYAAQCDGDWEHEYGIYLESLDNPGWRLRIDLAGTDLEGVVSDAILLESPGGTWLHRRSDGRVFEAACDAHGLGRALDAFSDFREHGRPRE
jgi:hypothetical protein